MHRFCLVQFLVQSRFFSNIKTTIRIGKLVWNSPQMTSSKAFYFVGLLIPRKAFVKIPFLIMTSLMVYSWRIITPPMLWSVSDLVPCDKPHLGCSAALWEHTAKLSCFIAYVRRKKVAVCCAVTFSITSIFNKQSFHLFLTHKCSCKQGKWEFTSRQLKAC